MEFASFDPTASSIIVPARVISPRGVRWLNMCLDTGSSRTVLDEEVAWRLGYEVMGAPKRVVTTASGETEAAIVPIRHLFSLGITVTDFPVLVLPLPPTLQVDGLLGLDFLRRRHWFFNFARGILVTIPFPLWVWQIWSVCARLTAAM